MRKSTIIGVVALVGVSAGGWYFGSPWWTLRQMGQAAQSKDADALADYVDFPALREDMKSELTAKMMADMPKDDGPFAELGKRIGLAMVNKVVDGMISPAGLKVMFAGSKAASAVTEETQTGRGSSEDIVVTSAPAMGQLSLDDVSMERDGLSGFRISKPGDAKPTWLIFKRDGLGWKLSGIDLPEGKLGG